MLTVAPSPNTTRPLFFDISSRTKWDAWELAGKTYEARPSEAEHRYLDIARDLGWKEGAPIAVASEAEERAAERGGGSGMGVSVSVMSSPQEDEDATGLHAYAMRDNVAVMSAFLQAGESLDIDARDEYVSQASQLSRFCARMPTVFYIFVGVHGTTFGCRSRECHHSRTFTQAWRR